MHACLRCITGRMKMILISCSVAVGLSGCARLGIPSLGKAPDDTVVVAPEVPVEVVVPVAAVTAAEAPPPDPKLTAAPPPPKAAKTAATLDTTTAAQKAAAAAPAAAPEVSKLLGTTDATLGSPTEPGFWLKTPLVKVETQGRVTNPANGKSSAVTLIPIDGPVTAGSRLSLPAMRLIEASLTDITRVEVKLEG